MQLSRIMSLNPYSNGMKIERLSLRRAANTPTRLNPLKIEAANGVCKGMLKVS